MKNMKNWKSVTLSGKQMNNIIYCGKKCIGKSTYLSKLSTGFVNFDKFIWTQLSTAQQQAYKARFKLAIESLDMASYQKLLQSLSSAIDWSTLLAQANTISTVYEMPALGMWWEFLPQSLRYNSFIFKLECSEEERIVRTRTRGCEKDIALYDFFYKDPPIIHRIIKV